MSSFIIPVLVAISIALIPPTQAVPFTAQGSKCPEAASRVKGTGILVASKLHQTSRQRGSCQVLSQSLSLAEAWVAVEEHNLCSQHEENFLFTINPYYGNLM